VVRRDRERFVVRAAIVVASIGMLISCGGGKANTGQGQVPAAGTARGATPGATPGTTAGPTPGATAGSPAGTPSTPAGTPAARSASNKSSPLKGKIIVLDPGHNGGNGAHPSAINRMVDIVTGRKECDTTGTESASGYSEHAYTWDVSNRLKKILQARGAKVILTRNSDTGVGPCINQRAAIGNRAKADVALSVHADGAPMSDHGFHIIEPAAIKGHTDKIVKSSGRLALALRTAYRKGTGIAYSNYIGKDALDVRSDLGGLNLSTVPKVFIETGNMANPGDIAKLADPKYRQRIAESLAIGLAAYFG
jgi:N-acetylmuramoyl-L-alanine amidase